MQDAGTIGISRYIIEMHTFYYITFYSFYENNDIARENLKRELNLVAYAGLLHLGKGRVTRNLNIKIF